MGTIETSVYVVRMHEAMGIDDIHWHIWSYLDSMDRNERLELVLRTLGDRPGVTASELPDDIGTSLRNVFRDIAYLRDRGYPIESSRGRGGGLSLHPNWGLGRVLLSAEEALGVLLSLALTDRLAARARARGSARFGEGRRLLPHAGSRRGHGPPVGVRAGATHHGRVREGGRRANGAARRAARHPPELACVVSSRV